MAEKKFIGKIAHFYSKIGVAVIDLEDDLSVGDKISIERGEEKFEQHVDSMQIENENIKQAKAGQSIGLRVKEKTKEGANVFKVIE